MINSIFFIIAGLSAGLLPSIGMRAIQQNLALQLMKIKTTSLILGNVSPSYSS